MKEIKINIAKGGRTKILAKGTNGIGTENFTEKLAKELGSIEERHKGGSYEHTQSGQNVEQH